MTTKRAVVAALIALRKVASSRSGGYAGQQALALQGYSPVMQRRELTPAELQEIDRYSSRPIPRIFKSEADPIAVDLASPGWAALLGAVPGAAVGGLIGLGLKRPGVGAAAGAGVAGLSHWLARRAANNTLLERMRRLPEGATRRDMYSDPALQAQLNRRAQMQAALVAAGYGNRK